MANSKRGNFSHKSIRFCVNERQVTKVLSLLLVFQAKQLQKVISYINIWRSFMFTLAYDCSFELLGQKP